MGEEGSCWTDQGHHCAHAAPEVLQRARSRYDAKQADVWSSGVMLFAMLCDAFPFERPEDASTLHGRTAAMVRRIVKGACS